MKTILKFATVLSVAILFASCGDKAQVKEAAESYLKASASYDYATIKQLVTPESLPLIEANEQRINDIPEGYKGLVKEAAKNTYYYTSIDAENITISEAGDAATVPITVDIDDYSDYTLTLKKVDGKWLIDVIGGAAVDNAVDVEETLEVDSTAVEEGKAEEPVE